MTRLTQSYLEEHGFQLSWGQEHSYRAQYALYDSDVTRAIILVSQTDCIEALREQDGDIYDVWFFGESTRGQYCEIDSHMSISSVEELETLMSYLR